MNGNHNSHVAIMLNLMKGLLHDVYLQLQLPLREATRDLQRITARSSNEGPEFLTKTLPLLGKAFDNALKGRPLQVPSNFRKVRGKNVPQLFRGLFERVFDKEGSVREDAEILAVRDIRQLTFLFYKYELPYRDSTVSEAMAKFVKIEEEIPQTDWSVQQMADIFYATEAINEALKDFVFEPAPRNGPGSVANGEKPWHRFRPHRFYEQLDALVPYDLLYYYNDHHLFDHFSGYFNLPYESDGVAKLMAVPKDSRGPRLISAEPAEFMTYEQALSKPLVRHIENAWITKGHVNFTCQDVNRDLALRSSVDKSFATLDLSDASDRLSFDLVCEVFGETSIIKWLKNARSTYTLIDGQKRLRLKKFAPMGSALTFPVEALTFWALIVGRFVANGMTLREAARLVYVYGDDIIVPRIYCDEAMDVLQSCGLKVNVEKSCFSGDFRESCGCDAFRGVDVTPTKVKKVWCSKPGISLLTSWVSYSNLFFRAGYWRMSEIISKMCESALGEKLPLVTDSSPILGLQTWTINHAIEGNKDRRKWNPDLQCYTVAGLASAPHKVQPPISGWERLVNISWYKPHESFVQDEEPYSSGSFAVRSTVRKYRAVVGEAFV